MESLKSYWPVALFAAWIGIRWWSSQRVVKILPALKARGATLVDVRTPQEYAGSFAAGTVNIPLQDLNSRINEIPKDKPVVVCCASGMRSASARSILRGQGYSEVYNIGPWTRLL
jgi:phage shock protein E